MLRIAMNKQLTDVVTNTNTLFTRHDVSGETVQKLIYVFYDDTEKPQQRFETIRIMPFDDGGRGRESWMEFSLDNNGAPIGYTSTLSLADIKFPNEAIPIWVKVATPQVANNSNLQELKVRILGKRYFQPVASKGFVTFIDDDGRNGVYTHLLPLFNSRNSKFTACIATGFIDGLTIEDDGMTSMELLGVEHYCTWQQLREVQDAGHEIAGHTVRHLKLHELTLEQQTYEIEHCKLRLVEEGFNPVTFVYPYGSENNLTHSIIMDNFDSGFKTQVHSVNKNNIIYGNLSAGTATRIPRVGLGSWGSSPTNEATNSIKEACLIAKETGGWLTLMTHVSHVTGGWNLNNNVAHITQVLDFCIANHIDVITAKEAMERIGWRDYSDV